MSDVVFASDLTKPDLLILQNLAADIRDYASNVPKAGSQETKATRKTASTATNGSDGWTGTADTTLHAEPKLSVQAPCTDILFLDSKEGEARDAATVATLSAMNDPKSAAFEPTVFSGVDIHDIRLPAVLDRWILQPYIRTARSVMRVETDVVMATHLLLYMSTLVPSALLLFFRHFTWIHGILHLVMQISYMGAYTLLMHQHIHMQGVLAKRFVLFDTLFPYIMDPLMGHSWNSYFYHHVKHHHVEGNGPDDLSSTVRFQRDSVIDFLHYTGRFYFFIWAELPLYFVRKGRTMLAAKVAFWELSWYVTLFNLFRFNARATLVVFLLPFLVLRFGLMLGNWGQHAFVDHDEPDSDYRSSITLIDVPVSLPTSRHLYLSRL